MNRAQVDHLVRSFPVDKLLPLPAQGAAGLDGYTPELLASQTDCEAFLSQARDAVIALELLKTRLTWLTGYAYERLATTDPGAAAAHGSAWQMAPAVEMSRQISFEESITPEGWQKARSTLPRA